MCRCRTNGVVAVAPRAGPQLAPQLGPQAEGAPEPGPEVNLGGDNDSLTKWLLSPFVLPSFATAVLDENLSCQLQALVTFFRFTSALALECPYIVNGTLYHDCAVHWSNHTLACGARLGDASSMCTLGTDGAMLQPCVTVDGRVSRECCALFLVPPLQTDLAWRIRSNHERPPYATIQISTPRENAQAAQLAIMQKDEQDMVGARYSNAQLILLAIAHVSVAKSATDVYACVEETPGRWVLADNPDVACFSVSWTWYDPLRPCISLVRLTCQLHGMAHDTRMRRMAVSVALC